MHILAIDTSADETSCAITNGRRVLSNVIYSQIVTHTKWGGIYPSLAKRAHEERIDWVVEKALKKLNLGTIDFIAITIGPGLAIALEVGIRKAKELAKKYGKKIIPVNHMEGHIYSSFVQNAKGNPDREFQFPYLALLISGGHTEIVLFKDHVDYQVLGSTRDDAAGEALDKAGRLLGLGYPGGPVIERLAHEIGNKDNYRFPRPMIGSKNLEFSFSGLKTSFFYFLHKMSAEDKVKQIKFLASSYQEAVFDTLLAKTQLAMKQTGINRLIVGGGVSANLYLRNKLRQLVKKHNGSVYFPPFKYLTGDNAAMIGVAAFFKAQKKMFVLEVDKIDRIPRLTL